MVKKIFNFEKVLLDVDISKEIFQPNLKVDELNLTTAWDGNKVIDLSKNLTQLY